MMLLRSGQFRRLGSRIYTEGSRIYIASTEYRTRDRVHTSSLESSPFRFRRDFNLSWNNTKKKKEAVLVRLRDWKSKERLVGMRMVCMYICEKGLSQQRERDRKAVEEEEKSFLHARENFERPCVFSFVFFLIFLWQRRRRRQRRWAEIVRLD